MKEKTEGSTDAELQQYVIGDKEAEALKHSKIPASGIVSVESTKLENQNGSDKTPKKRSKDKHSSESKSKSSKKRKAWSLILFAMIKTVFTMNNESLY